MAMGPKDRGAARTIGFLSLIVTIVAGIYFPLASFQGWPPFSQSPKVQLEDAFVDDDPGSFPILDIKVLNTGKQTAVLKRAHFTVDKVWKVTPTSLLSFMALQPSAKYEVMLKIRDQETYSISTKISHSLQPNEPDRFTVILNHDAPVQEDLIVRMSVDLIYGDSKSLTIPNLLYVAQRPGFQGNYLSASSGAKAVAREIQNVDGKRSNGLRQLLSKILSSP